MTTASLQPFARLGHVVSVQAGRVQSLGTPRAADPLKRPWRSAFFKEPLSGSIRVGPTGLAGDQQADSKSHGGPEKALLMYSGDHFPQWRDFGLEGLTGGGFGENLTVTGFAEEGVCIGDRLRVGSTLLEVSQPRQPCSNINRRWGRKGVTEAVLASGKGGWYLRVVETGSLEGGDVVELVVRPFASLTIALANDALYGRTSDVGALGALIACGALTDSFRRGLQKRLAEITIR